MGWYCVHRVIYLYYMEYVYGTKWFQSKIMRQSSDFKSTGGYNVLPVLTVFFIMIIVYYMCVFLLYNPVELEWRNPQSSSEWIYLILVRLNNRV